MEITAGLAAFVAATDFEQLPASAIDQARRAFLDTIGVALAGSLEECARIAAQLAREEGGSAAATLIGQGFAAPARAAALVNGTAAHALDYDDVSTDMRGHPSPPLIPAVLAAGEETGASGGDLLTAYVVGFEIESRLGRGLGRSHYPHGWHATSTTGTLGAAAAAARLYGLDPARTCMALGIATSLASGSRQNFGTMTKPLHPGVAASGGILAAKLAASGFTADAKIVEAPLGYLNLFSPARDAQPQRVLEGLGEQWEILQPGISIKKYPCCFNTHRALDAVLTLRQGSAFGGDDVESIHVTVPRGAVAALIHPRPRTGLEGKFSMEYCLAAAVLDGRMALDTFRDEAVLRPAAQALLRRIELEQTEERAPSEDAGYADVEVRLRDGRRLRHRVDDPRGGPSAPLSLPELEVKYRDCAERVIGAEATERSLTVIEQLETLADARELMVLLSGSRMRASV